MARQHTYINGGHSTLLKAIFHEVDGVCLDIENCQRIHNVFQHPPRGPCPLHLYFCKCSAVSVAPGTFSLPKIHPLTNFSRKPHFKTRQAPTTLNAAIVAKGKEYVGTALTIRNDTSESELIINEFGSITPENAMKWESTEPTQNNFTFADADAVVDFATSNDKSIRCHTLVWYSQLPAWVSNSGFDNATLIDVITNHINTVVGRYKGVCNQWDVVNEGKRAHKKKKHVTIRQSATNRLDFPALNEDGTYRDNVFLQVIGEAYIPIAFALAAAADPDARLFYNDYNLEAGTAKAQGAARIVQLVQSYGVRIDGVGLQAHLTSEATPSSDNTVAPDLATLTSTLALFTDLGVDVAYTELDVRFLTPVTEEKLAAQAAVYVDVFNSCLANARCVGVTIWGVSDLYSWIPGVFDGEGAALLWDEAFAKKPAYEATLEAINGFGNSTSCSRR